jgi:hypothetical protein
MKGMAQPITVRSGRSAGIRIAGAMQGRAIRRGGGNGSLTFQTYER